MRSNSVWTRLLSLTVAGGVTTLLTVACSGGQSSEALSESSSDVVMVPAETGRPASGSEGVDLESLRWQYTVIDENGREMTGDEAVQYLASKGAPEPILRAIADGRPFPNDLPKGDAADEAWKRVGIRITITGTVPINLNSNDRDQDNDVGDPFRF